MFLYVAYKSVGSACRIICVKDRFSTKASLRELIRQRGASFLCCSRIVIRKKCRVSRARRGEEAEEGDKVIYEWLVAAIVMLYQYVDYFYCNS